MTAGATGFDLAAYELAKQPLRKFLGKLKSITRSGNRFFVTGLTPIAMAGESIWNVADHLTFKPPFADMLGLTVAEVRAART